MEIVHPTLDAFTVLKQIGAGTFASVYCVQHNELGFKAAIKVYHHDKEFNAKAVKHAFNISRQVRHPLICEEFDMFQWEGKLCTLIEYVDGMTLLDYANEYGPLSDYEIQTILGQVVIAVQYLHSRNIIHRDLKCENIMIDTFHNIRLIDFGFACVMANQNDLRSTTCGSPAYVAPEIIQHASYDFSVDIWSLGVVLYAVSIGYLPFEDPSLSRLLEMINNEEPEFPDFLTDKLADLIKCMLRKDPQERITIDGIMTHPFFTLDDFGRSYVFDGSIFMQFEDGDLNMMVIRLMKLSGDEISKLKVDLQNNEKNAKVLTYQILQKSFLASKISGFGRLFLKPCQPKMTFQYQPYNPYNNYNTSKSYNGKTSLLPSYEGEDSLESQGSSFKGANSSIPSFPKVVIRKPRNLKVRPRRNLVLNYQPKTTKSPPNSYSPISPLSRFGNC